MDLEELLVNAGDRGGRVIIVENIIDEQNAKTNGTLSKVLNAQNELSDLTRDLFGRPVDTTIIHPQSFKSALAGNKEILSEIKPTDLILFSGYTPGGFPHLASISDSINAMTSLQNKMPEIPSSNYAFILPSQKEDGPLQRVWKHIFKDILGKGEDFFKYVIHGPFFASGDSLVSVLRADASGLKHRVGSLKDARFMDYLSHQFTLGSNQTGMKKTFLCINDKLKERNGRFVVLNHETGLDNINFNDFHAVFIDNGWDKQEGRLGKGMASLMKVSRALENKGLNLPIIYQTAHNLESISVEERAQILAFSNTYLISKNLAPKLSRSKKVATKELETSRLLKECPELRPYVVEAVAIGSKGFIRIYDRFLTFSRAAAAPELIDSKNMVHHRMYVLANLHAHFENQIANPTLALVGKRFRDFPEIQESIHNHCNDGNLIDRLNALRPAYEQSVATHAQLPIQTVIHNDSKWDNWFAGGYILGDFGSTCPGRESKDLASTLLDPTKEFENTLNREHIDLAVKKYMELRKSISPKFNQTTEQMRKEVYGMLVVESLRQAYYKIGYDLNLAKGLVKVAETYAPLAL